MRSANLIAWLRSQNQSTKRVAYDQSKCLWTLGALQGLGITVDADKVLAIRVSYSELDRLWSSQIYAHIQLYYFI